MGIVTLHRWNKFIHCQDDFFTPNMQTLLRNIDEAIAHPVKVLKDDRTSTVVLMKVDEKLLVIKRANTKDWTHGIRRIFSLSRARKNWRNANKLLSIGVKTFYPVAMMEERWGPLKGRSYFICSYLQGQESLAFFANPLLLKSEWVQMAQKINALIQKLAKHWISHRDLNLSNIIIVDNEPWIIDLESMRQHWFHLSAKRGAKRELARFMENWQESEGLAHADLFQSVFSI